MDEVYRSICMPSNRPLGNSQRSIESALTYIKLNKDTDFSVSDNSGDLLKSEKFGQQITDRFSYHADHSLSETQNWLNAAKLSSGKFIAFMGDDDFIISTKAQMTRIDNPLTIGLRPNIIVWDKNSGVTAGSNFAITERTAKDRIQKYFELAKGNNNTLYSFIRRDISLDINFLCQEFHPVKTGYYDWAIVLAYLSSGILQVDHSNIYVYDNNNWNGSEIDISNRIKSLFEKGGVSDRAAYFIKFFLGIDSFILILRRQSPTSRGELEEAAIFSLYSYMQSFAEDYNKHKNLFTSAEQSIIELGSQVTDINNMLSWILKVIESFSEHLVPKYINFYENCIYRPWGKF